MRIELTALAWKAKVLPLYDIRLLTNNMEEQTGIEPLCKPPTSQIFQNTYKH